MKSIPSQNLKQTGTYLLTNRINGKKYVGQSQNLKARWSQHLRGKGDQPISRAIRKYGVENFSFDVIEICAIDQLDDVESLYIAYANSLVPNGYNVQPFAKSNRGVKASEETRRKMSISQKSASSRPDVARKKQIAIKAARNLPNAKLQQSLSAIEFHSRPATKEKHRAALKAASARPDVKARQRAASKETNARPEVRAKLRAAHTKKFVPVAQYTLEGALVAQYECTRDAARAIGKGISAVCLCVHGKAKTAYGFIWRYAQPGQQSLFL